MKFQSYIFILPRGKIFISMLSMFFGFATLNPHPSHAAPVTDVDILLLFDDTGSFSTNAPAVRDIFTGLVDDVEARLPGVEIGFGVARFQDFGGSGWDYCSNRSENCSEDFGRRVNGRPFYLNQPIVTSTSVGGRANRDSLIIEALSRGGPGTGGDDPESHIEALWQIARGLGLDGNEDGQSNGFDGSERAMEISTQITPDRSGDVPAFSSLVSSAQSSGSLGGVGFRPESLKLVLIATEICAALPFQSGRDIPRDIQGRYSTEAVADFACFSTTPGDDRFGFVGNAPSFAANTIRNAVAPLGAATFPDTIAALNASDIRVIGMGPGLIVKAKGSGPDHDASGLLSALARITGAVDSLGKPLVFDIGVGGTGLKDKIVQSILVAATENPGCVEQDLNAVFTTFSRDLRRQRSAALRLAKKTQSPNDYRATSRSIKKLMALATKVSRRYPKIVTVCQTTACPSTSHIGEIKQLTTVTKRLDRSIASSVRNLRDRRLSRKESASQKRLRVASLARISAIPVATHNCS